MLPLFVDRSCSENHLCRVKFNDRHVSRASVSNVNRVYTSTFHMYDGIALYVLIKQPFSLVFPDCFCRVVPRGAKYISWYIHLQCLLLLV